MDKIVLGNGMFLTEINCLIEGIPHEMVSVGMYSELNDLTKKTRATLTTPEKYEEFKTKVLKALRDFKGKEGKVTKYDCNNYSTDLILWKYVLGEPCKTE